MVPAFSLTFVVVFLRYHNLPKVKILILKTASLYTDQSGRFCEEDLNLGGTE